MKKYHHQPKMIESKSEWKFLRDVTRGKLDFSKEELFFCFCIYVVTTNASLIRCAQIVNKGVSDLYGY